jgi:hypothetical protein
MGEVDISKGAWCNIWITDGRPQYQEVRRVPVIQDSVTRTHYITVNRFFN